MVVKLLTFIVLLEKYSMASKSSLRVIGGRNAEKDEFPFVVRLDIKLIEYKDKQIFELYHRFCTGSLIAPTWTLTAAHCIDSIDLKSYVYYIRYNSSFPENKGEVSKMLEFHIHPRYRFVLQHMRYDIALVKTENTIVSKYAKLSGVDYTTLFGHEAYGMGYGLTNVTENPPPLQVLKGMLSVCPNTGNNAYMSGIFAGICLRTLCNVEATMTPGNSGSPLFHKTGIVGVLSMGDIKYSPNTNSLKIPVIDAEEGVYTSISPNLDWILTIVRRK